MSKMNQRNAVYNAIVAVLSEAGIHFEDGMDVKPIMTRELRGQVNAILFQGFQSGSNELDRSYSDTELKSYVSGLQSNWIRKDSRLNGAVKYSPKNPGSRAGSGDDQLKALRALLSQTTDETERTEIQGYIDARLTELKKSKAPTISVEALPEALRHLVK